MPVTKLPPCDVSPVGVDAALSRQRSRVRVPYVAQGRAVPASLRAFDKPTGKTFFPTPQLDGSGWGPAPLAVTGNGAVLHTADGGSNPSGSTVRCQWSGFLAVTQEEGFDSPPHPASEVPGGTGRL